ATTASAGLFHIVGVTPEAPTRAAALGGEAPEQVVTLTPADLRGAWIELNPSTTTAVGLVALGNPHFSLAEFAQLAALCARGERRPAVDLVVTTSRHVHAQATAAGHLAAVERFGARVITDTCWCMIGAPIVGQTQQTIVTNSAKYA